MSKIIHFLLITSLFNSIFPVTHIPRYARGISNNNNNNDNNKNSNNNNSFKNEKEENDDFFSGHNFEQKELEIKRIKDRYACKGKANIDCEPVTEFWLSSRNAYKCNEEYVEIHFNCRQVCSPAKKYFAFLTPKPGAITLHQSTSLECPRIKRYYINEYETLIVMDQEAKLLSNKKINQFIYENFWSTQSYTMYLMFLLDYYDEATDSVYKLKLIWELFRNLFLLVSFLYLLFKIKKWLQNSKTKEKKQKNKNKDDTDDDDQIEDDKKNAALKNSDDLELLRLWKMYAEHKKEAEGSKCKKRNSNKK